MAQLRIISVGHASSPIKLSLNNNVLVSDLPRNILTPYHDVPAGPAIIHVHIDRELILHETMHITGKKTLILRHSPKPSHISLYREPQVAPSQSGNIRVLNTHDSQLVVENLGANWVTVRDENNTCSPRTFYVHDGHQYTVCITAQNSASAILIDENNSEALNEERYSRPLDEIKHSRPLDEIKHSRPLDEIKHSRPLDEIKHSRPLDEIKHSRPLQSDWGARLADYTGTWWQIASIPQFYSGGCVRQQAQYTLEGKSIRVLNTCFDGDGRIVRQGLGRASAPDPDVPAALRVEFDQVPSFSPPGANYLVHETDYDNYVIVGSPDSSSLYILTRQPSILRSDYDVLLDKVTDLGYDINRLVVDAGAVI